MFFEFFSAGLALIFALAISAYILKQDEGIPRAKELSRMIKKGAATFLNTQYKYLIFFVLFFFVVLLFVDYRIALAFFLGSFFSAAAGNFGMRIATSSNSRVAHACEKSSEKGLKIAFSSGTVMALLLSAFGIFGIALLYTLFKNINVLFGFSFGASSIALFARVAGGIYTKSADMGADLAGKLEKKLEEDDPRNPAVIADQVGDNVGDVAGMGADLFESYVGVIVGAMAISILAAVKIPLLVASLGIIASMLSYFFVKGKGSNALSKGIVMVTLFTAVLCFLFVRKFFFSIFSGLFAGLLLGFITQYYTAPESRTVKKTAQASQTGAATNILSGFSSALLSTFLPTLLICAVVIFSYKFDGFYGIGLAGVGMLSTLGITLGIDCFHPVVDNAAGISEMAKMKKARKNAEALDAIGNTTAAIGKGFAIGSAALTAIVFFSVFSSKLQINMLHPNIFSGILIGASLPFLFSSFTIKAVSAAAFRMIEEVRKQFSAILEKKAKPDYEKCIEISTKSAIKGMMLPGVIAIIFPVLVGFILGKEALAGMLLGSTFSGFLLAILLANAGCIWDNSKKYIEAGFFGGKKSKSHDASIIADTVGDPFKDTAGPSLNILIKLMGIISLLLLPFL